MRTRQPKRRGVLLLVVLSLLALFVLVGTTYVATSGMYRRTTNSIVQAERQETSPSQDFDTIVMEFVRGSQDPRSLLRFHNLLSDLYGIDGFRAVIDTSAATPSANGQWIDLNFSNVEGNQRTIQGYYNGGHVTVISGPLAGTTVEIIASNANGLTIVRPPNMEQLSQLTNERIAVNGMAFNGTGVGLFTEFTDDANFLEGDINQPRDVYFFDAATGATNNLDVTTHDTGRQVALLPGFAKFTLPDDVLTGRGLLPSFATLGVNEGGEDESWDAVDYQNMFLAWLPSQAADQASIIPSFHRPALLNYWRSREGTNGELPADLLRQVSLRPNWIDHPLFDGGNPVLTPALDAGTIAPGESARLLSHLIGQDEFDTVPVNWDVDNDGDGLRDSIWVDVGLPVRISEDGKQYKPLAAILCIDLDGRIDLNTAGIVAGGTVDPTITDPSVFAQQTAPTVYIRGSGLGPFDVTLPYTLDNAEQANDISATERQTLAEMRFSSGVDASGQPGIPDEDDKLQFLRSMIKTIDENGDLSNLLRDWWIAELTNEDSVPKFSPGNAIGFIDGWGLASQATYEAARQDSLQIDNSDQLGVRSTLLVQRGGVLDVRGNSVVGLGHAGQPIMQSLDGSAGPDSPYDATLLTPGHHDELFTVFDEEGLLRIYDADVKNTSSRLRESFLSLAGGSQFRDDPEDRVDDRNRRTLTTRSRYISNPPRQLPWGWRGDHGAVLPGGGHATDFVELLRGVVDPDHIDYMFPPEVLRGRRMDINRLLAFGPDFDKSNGGSGFRGNGVHDIEDMPGPLRDEMLALEKIGGNDMFFFDGDDQTRTYRPFSPLR
ncbi:MAG: hypothetical protein AAF497_16790, partial [Planctomycetota bacterium]